ncbi:atlastin-2-like [Clavelina lepadiformis]|uniref:atlastin-2-like n=1 Tax=Clavelina lepadiformis TaxID=159417 RepID=UPI0040424577
MNESMTFLFCRNKYLTFNKMVVDGDSVQNELVDDTERGTPVPVVLVNDDHTFTLDEDAISSILLKKEIADLPVVVISVAGAFRKGKSFLLNFLLRFLSNYENENWIGDSDESLSGFSWRGGSDRVTTGILMWSEVFQISTPAGLKVAVVLMDTQGAFDSSSTVKDCATVFALSTMTSSVQIYNISQNIQEDDFQHLELFTEYGRLALEESDVKPFQSLQFLVRDWSYPYEYEYGVEGGRKLLNKRLELSEKQHEELQRVRTHIRSCFDDLSCFLMPHPGLAVATNPHFKGALKDITPDFKEYMLKLAPMLLAPEKLKVKEIHGSAVKCSELVEYFRSYIKIYHGEKLPEPKSMLQATAEANNLAAVAKARDLYSSSMDQVCGSSSAFVNPTVLDDKHIEYKELSLDCFDNTRKMGGVEFSTSYREKLEVDIVEMYDNYVRTNSAKNVFRNVRTPSVYLVVGAICYLMSGLFGFLYLTSFATICNIFLFITVVSILSWSYVQFTGNHQDIGKTLDVVADFLWENFLSNIYNSVIQQGAKQLTQETMRQLTEKVKSN